MNNFLSPYRKRISDNIELFIWDIDSLSDDLKSLIDHEFVSIYEGSSTTSLSTVKKKARKLFEGKNQNWVVGATAEFFLHLFLRQQGYSQQCLFKNLEEHSIKKGFDGYYTFNDDEWIMESKAGLKRNPETTNTHEGKIKIAIKDVEKKVAGKEENNPWENAFNHAKIADANAKILDNLRKLDNEFAEGGFHTIDEFNVIPCATLYYQDEEFENKNSIENQFTDISFFNAKKQIVLCASYRSFQILQEYINL